MDRTYRRVPLFCFTGIDGCGKSTQVRGLAQRLRAAGWPTATVWTGGQKTLTGPLVRLVQTDGEIRFARVTVGGVAPVPLRMWHVEQALLGHPASHPNFQRAARHAADSANPLPMTRYKVSLLPATIHDALIKATTDGSGTPG